MINYENTKPLYEKLGLRPGYGSFSKCGNFACPITVHKEANTEIGTQFKEGMQTNSRDYFNLISFAWGFDGQSATSCMHDKSYNETYFLAGKALREKFEQEAPVADIPMLRQKEIIIKYNAVNDKPH